MKKIIPCILSFCLILPLSALAQKTIYEPTFFKTEGIILSSTSSKFCNARSKQNDDIIIFWESGFGSDPSTASASYKVDINKVLQEAQKAYNFYIDSLKFVIKGKSVTDKYKLMIFLLYSTEWAAYGSGQDNLVGTLHVNNAAANIPNVVAHEIGHCFEYLTGCDGLDGFQYGLGDNGKGGNGYWEQIAQWMSFKVYPEKQFTENDFNTYVKSNHLHLLHETPRYANYFIGDYWAYKRGIDFQGKLWRESKNPEDPVDAYKRLNAISQEQFNDEMYEHASRLTTWDLPQIRSYGQNYIDRRAQPKMNLQSDKFWLIDTSACPENYGYNSIKLNAPATATTVSVTFQGKIGASGFRSKNPAKGGWRFGFVALLKDNSRIYSDMGTANYSGSVNPDESMSFDVPVNCSKLWFVVSGAPQEHWHHEWDTTTSNDEQWPYQVQFSNTNLLGQTTGAYEIASAKSSSVNPVIVTGIINLPLVSDYSITNLAGKTVLKGVDRTIDISKFSNGSYILNHSGKSTRLIKNSSKSVLF
ncbi:MAG: DUF6055 domain-containing protein [Fibrobacterota bacterium]|nr:DUF6055 domain-containing protein [Chitinispirillaceae bacterium]